MINTLGVDIVVVACLLWFFISVTWFSIEFFYFIRPILPVRVNCWFCNNSFWVLYKTSNSWDCPGCLQYNGFSEDGDYNREIPEQYECMNRSFAVPRLMTRIPHELCEQCNKIQEEKIKKLAKFRPENPARYDAELKDFRNRLERIYSLCTSCEMLVSRIINQKLAKALRVEFNNSNQKYEKARQPVSSKWPVFCHMLCFTLAVCLGVATWFNVDNRDPENLVFFRNILDYKQYLTYIPLSVLLLVIIRGSGSLRSVSSLIMWMAVNFLPWLIIMTGMSAHLDNWTKDNFEWVLLSVAALISIIAAMERVELKNLRLTKIRTGSHNSNPSSGMQCTKPTESSIKEHREMNTKPQFSWFTKKLKVDDDIVNRQFGIRPFSYDEQESGNTYNRTSVIRPPRMDFPEYEAMRVPRPQMSSLVRRYRHLPSSTVFSSQNSIFPWRNYQKFH